MAALNRVLLIGNLTCDPEIRYTQKGTALTEIGLAINRAYTGDDERKNDEVTFVDVVLWGRIAEVAEKYLRKGSPVFVEGRLQLDSWDDKQTGQKRSRRRVVAENLQFLGGKTGPQRQISKEQNPPGNTTNTARNRGEDIEAECIPF